MRFLIALAALFLLPFAILLCVGCAYVAVIVELLRVAVDYVGRHR